MVFDRTAIQGSYVNIGGKLYAKSSLTDAQLRSAVAANPSILATGWILNGGQVVKGAAPTAEAPATPTAAAPAAPTVNQFSNYWQTDGDYLNGAAGLRNQLGLVMNPDGTIVHQADQQKLAGLTQLVDPLTYKPVAPGTVGGKTMYDILYGQQQSNDVRSLDALRSDAYKRGVSSSSYADHQLTDFGSQTASAYDQLMRNYGTDLTDSRSAAYQLNQDQSSAVNNYNAQLGGLQGQSIQHGYENALNNYSNTYGSY